MEVAGGHISPEPGLCSSRLYHARPTVPLCLAHLTGLGSLQQPHLLNPCRPRPVSPPPLQSHNNQTPHQSPGLFSTVISLIVTLPGSFLPAKCRTRPPECQILDSSKRATPYCAWLKANAAPSDRIPIIFNNPDSPSGIQYKTVPHLFFHELIIIDLTGPHRHL